jgi:hypothetical protein
LRRRIGPWRTEASEGGPLSNSELPVRIHSRLCLGNEILEILEIMGTIETFVLLAFCVAPLLKKFSARGLDFP